MHETRCVFHLAVFLLLSEKELGFREFMQIYQSMKMLSQEP